MEVSFNAFHLVSMCPEIPLVDYLDYLCGTISGKENKNQILYIIKKQDFYIGVFLSIQNRNKFFTLTRENGKIVVTEEQLKKGTQITDFNFFIIDAKSGIGIYQYYRKSFSLSKFLHRLSIYYNKYFRIRKQAVIAIAKKGGANEKLIEDIKSGYTGYLKFSIIERKGKLEERIASLKDITHVGYTFEAFSYDGQSDKAPLLPIAKNISHEVTLIPDIPFSEKLKHVARFIRENVFLRAIVKGKGQDNQDVTYKMLNDYDKFDSYDYDDLFTSMTIDSNNINYSLNENNIIIHLLSCFNKNRIHFGLL